MIQTFLFCLALLGFALALLCVRLLLGRRFVHTHVTGNAALARRGIHCAQTQDREQRTPSRHRIAERAGRKPSAPHPTASPHSTPQ